MTGGPGPREEGYDVLLTLVRPDGTGSPRMARDYVEELTGSGLRVVVAHGPVGPEAAPFLEGLDRAATARVPVPGFKGLAAVRTFLRVLSLARGSRVVIGFQQRDRIFAALAGRLARRPVVVVLQNQHRFWGPGPVRRLKRGLYRAVLGMVRPVLVCSSEAVREEVEGDLRLGNRELVVIRNGIDTERLKARAASVDRGAVRARMGWAPDETVALNVGRINPQKGLKELVEAVRRVASDLDGRPLRLVVVGQAEEEGSAYEREVREAAREAEGVRIDFPGWRDDVPELLAASDLYLHSALWEGWPLAVMEAMAAGTPVVATDCSGVPDGFVQGAHGFFVEAGSPAELAEAATTLIRMDADARRSIGRGGQEFALRHFDHRAAREAFRALVERCLARGRPA